jgi:hypothetical protein
LPLTAKDFKYGAKHLIGDAECELVSEIL